MTDLKHQIAAQLPFLNRIAWFYTRDINVRNDLVQDTLLQAVRKAHLFKQETNGNLQGWLSVLLRHTFINRHQRMQWKGRRKEADPVDLLSESFRHPSYSISPEANMMLPIVVKEVADNHPIYFDWLFSDRTYEQLAVDHKIPCGTVKLRIHNSRKELRDKFDRDRTLLLRF